MQISDGVIKKCFNTALTAAQAGGENIKKELDSSLDIDFKGRANIVTQVDRGTEEIIVNIIKSRFPEHKILAEETPPVKDGASLFKWIIDPLDGTTNFVHNFPFFAVSVALEYDEEVVIGVIYDPVRKELFSAIKERGSYLNKTPIRVSEVEKISDSLLATGFPYELNEDFYKNMKLFKKFYERSQGVRRAGAAALDLCYIACGRLDGFWEYGLNPWDVAAGSLIVSEAGGRLSNFNGCELSIYENQILASNNHIHDEMLEVLKNS
jgi:myo-inositol-1(or 4)-monophosphatase